MREYLNHKFNADDPDLVSVIDELPLWSAPFGLSLLDTIILKPNIKVLDVGCGLGFPLIEIANRLDSSSLVYGIDPWESALDRVRLKINTYNLSNVKVLKGVAENLPFDDEYFDLIVSNNGINNVEDVQKTLIECYRVSKASAQFAFTVNLEDTMIEFYNVLETVLKEKGMNDEVGKMKEQIYSKRKPLQETTQLLENSGFKLTNIDYKEFYLRFTDGETMFNHSLVKYWFLDGWKKVVKAEDLENVFGEVEDRLNKFAAKKGEIVLTVPYVTIDCRK